MKGEFTKESSKLTLCLQNSYRMAKVLCIPENVFVLVSFHIKDLIPIEISLCTDRR